MPGAYSLAGDNLAPHLAKLEQVDHVKNYVFAREAGEPMSSYPAWSPVLEHRWCVWARAFAPVSLYQALLLCCDPEEWPITEEQLRFWIAEKARSGTAAPLARPSPSYSPSTPTPEDLVSTLIDTSIGGGTSWHRINRILNLRSDVYAAWPVLALLVYSGVVTAAPDCGDWHPARLESPWFDGDSWRQIRRERMMRSKLTWGDGPLSSFVDTAYQEAERGELAWIRGRIHGTFMDILGRMRPVHSGTGKHRPSLDDMLLDTLLDLPGGPP